MSHSKTGETPPRSETEKWFQLTYQELRSMAHKIFSAEGAERTIQPTALVHEAYLRLHKHRNPWVNREHFLSMAAQAMRRVLIDLARQRDGKKRGGHLNRITLTEDLHSDQPVAVEILDFDAALTKLAGFDSRKARLVEFRVFGGMTLTESAEQLGISDATVNREWKAARAWLSKMLLEEGPTAGQQL